MKRTRFKETLPGLNRILHRFWPYVRPHKTLLAGSSFALVATTGLRLLEPWPLKYVFDNVIPVSRPIAGETLSPGVILALAALGLVVITALRALAEYYRTVGFSLLGNRVLTNVRDDLYRHLQSLSLSFHHRARSGDLVVRVIGDVNMLKDAAVTAVLPLLGSVLVLVGIVAVMFWLEWRLTLVTLAILPLFWFASAMVGRRIQEVANKQRRREGAMASTAAEAIGAIKTVQALGLESAFADVFSSRSRESLRQDVKGSKLSAKLERSADILGALATALVLWYGAVLVLRGSLTPGDLLVFLAYQRRIFNPLQDYAKYTARLAKATAAGERVLDLLDREPDVRDLPGAESAPTFRGEVEFEGVTFSYEDKRQVLQDISFTVDAGQTVALVGPSGIGKSTLLSLIMRLYDPDSGAVKIDGRDLREYTLFSLRSQISVVLQENLLFAGSVYENIACASPECSAQEVEAAAKLANAHEFILAMPDGYESAVGERGATLSHGQRQRIAIARAAIRKTPILILDEPLAGLDEENEQEVAEALARLSEGRTTFLVTHNLDRVVAAHQILYLDSGTITERGTHAELANANGQYAALLASRSGEGQHRRADALRG